MEDMERFLQKSVGLKFFQGLRLNTLGHIPAVNLLSVSFTENEETVCLNEQSNSKKEQKYLPIWHSAFSILQEEVFTNLFFYIAQKPGTKL